MLAQIQCVLCGIDFHSNPQAFLCKACQNQNQYPVAVVQLKSNKSLEFRCPICTYKNPAAAIQCEICHHVFEDRLDRVQPKKPEVKQLVTCKKCKFQNHIMNEYCLNCEEELFEHVKKTCGICGLSVKEDNFKKHEQDCKMSLLLIEKEENERVLKQPEFNFKDYQESISQVYPLQVKPIAPHPKLPVRPLKRPIEKPLLIKQPIVPPKPGLLGSILGAFGKGQQSTTISCYYCYKKFSKGQINNHTQKCQKKDEWQRNMSPAHSRMTPLQVKAIQYMHSKSMKEHQSVRRQLEQRVQKLGYSNQDLENLSYYIENYAPIIIQIHISKHMEFFVKDTHYRSQFETNKSSGSLSRTSRIQWEDRMFDEHYSKATDFERVKYGVINFTNDPKGVNCAKAYGPSYFLLKSHVRDRCTFTDKDSSGADASIATLKFPFQIISKMNDAELKAAFSASKALEMSSSVIITYKQVQIHGPIEFSKDIERVYASKAQINGNKNLLDLVYKFSEMFKVQHDFI